MILHLIGFRGTVCLVETKVMYQPTRVRIFVKPYCGWCAEAMEWLGGNKIKYNMLDVTSDRAAWDEMVRLSGQNRIPVIEVDGKMLSDFGASELARFWDELG
ncbi:MAG TPA: glutaredoxin family protein [Verrucomicrobiota bacterium]|nr:glutaredoxin family protein [Verrucomicrobiota bacterium]